MRGDAPADTRPPRTGALLKSPNVRAHKLIGRSDCLYPNLMEASELM